MNMVVINEYQFEQYEIGRRTNCQERSIIFSSWEAYVEEIKNFNTTGKLRKKSVPKGSKLTNIQAGDKYLTFEFVIDMGSRSMNINHIATLLLGKGDNKQWLRGLD